MTPILETFIWLFAGPLPFTNYKTSMLILWTLLVMISVYSIYGVYHFVRANFGDPHNVCGGTWVMIGQDLNGNIIAQRGDRVIRINNPLTPEEVSDSNK